MTDVYSEQRVREIVDEVITLQTSDIRVELRSNGVFLEEAQGTLRQILELLSKNLRVEKQVVADEQRIDKLEANQQLLTATVRDHSERLKRFQ